VMSKLSDYSKFDHLESSDDDEEDVPSRLSQHQQATSTATTAPVQRPGAAGESSSSGATIRRHPNNPKRFIFEHDGNPIYEFEQSLNEVVLYVPAPPATVVCQISAHHLKLGLQGVERAFIDEDTAGAVDTTESTWCIEEDDNNNNNKQKMICIYLQKMAKGTVWSSALKGRFDATIDPLSLQQVQKELMLERFQEENPGMDFRDAEFNGSVPDPRDFMGGVRYD